MTVTDETLHRLGGHREHTLTLGNQQAVITEAGAGLRDYTVADAPVVAGYSADELCPSGRGQWLVPWPNRIADGRYTFDGTEQSLPIKEADPRNAIHGFARWAAFDLLERTETWVDLGAVLPARPGYPWALAVVVRWELGPGGLSTRLTVRNLGTSTAPFGAGAHPYLAPGGELVDQAGVTVPGATRITGDGGLMTERSAVGPDDDFRTARQIGDHRLGLYTDLDRDADGIAHTVLDRSDGLRVDLWQDEAWPFVLLYTADGVSDAEGKRGSLAIEPMTCAVDAFNTGDGLITLAPGRSSPGPGESASAESGTDDQSLLALWPRARWSTTAISNATSSTPSTTRSPTDIASP
ncbi:aldose 1-epimerase family protein [Ruania alba]|uniref:Aldose 1-epimerase n=1 Tax=Ruania alba TaxID=648782 RepID=A0A1H5KCK1_9MICO|nr:aldose 1-epimerase family protein [Ruania alba]SEE62533.1 aldose 1-epimerase [Ruania alba]